MFITMELNKTIVIGIVIFMLFGGRCSAASVEEKGKDDVLSEETEVESELKFDPYINIKTYLDVVNGTLFQTTSKVDVETQNPEQYQNEIDSKMKNVEKTYGKYAYTHLLYLSFMRGSTMSSKFGFLMPIVFKDDAIRVFSKGKLSFENIGYELPEWMQLYLEFLNDIEFQKDAHENTRILFTPQFEESMNRIKDLLLQVTDDFLQTSYTIPLTPVNGNVHLFAHHLPWMYFNNLFITFKGVYNELKCMVNIDELKKSAPEVFDECQSILYFNLMVHNLMQLQIILDVNRELLRYIDDDSIDTGSDRGKFEVRQTENSSGSKLMNSFFNIKTYRDVNQRTLFQTSTENNTRVTPDELESKFADKIKNVELTYAAYAYRHFEFLVYLTSKKVSSNHNGPMTINLQTNALEVLSKCKYTFEINGLPLPEWLPKYTALLNAIEFQTIDKKYSRIFVAGPLLKAIVEINTLFTEIFDGFPNVHVLSNEGDGEKNFVKRVLPWKVLHFFVVFYANMFNNCRTKMYDTPVDHSTMIDCAAINYYYRVAYNLMELQIILDVNKELLPYYN